MTANGWHRVDPFDVPDEGRVRGVAVDGLGDIFIADTNNQRIRMVDTAGIIHTLRETEPPVQHRGTEFPHCPGSGQSR